MLVKLGLTDLVKKIGISAPKTDKSQIKMHLE